MNRTPNPTTKTCPEKLQTGIDPPSLIEGFPHGIPVEQQNEEDQIAEIFRKLKKKADERCKRAPRHKHKWVVNIGDRVLVKDHKLSSKLRGRYHRMELLYKGPMVVVKQFGDHTYELQDPRNEKIIGRYHKQLLRPFKTNTQN